MASDAADEVVVAGAGERDPRLPAAVGREGVAGGASAVVAGAHSGHRVRSSGVIERCSNIN